MAIQITETSAVEFPEIAPDATMQTVTCNADAPPAAGPDDGAGDTANARQEAVWAALVANPGAPATAIGAAAGISRVAAGKILNRLEAEGRARRTAGGHDGQTRGRTRDLWYPAADTAATDDIPAAEPAAAVTSPDAVTDGTDGASDTDENELPNGEVFDEPVTDGDTAADTTEQPAQPPMSLDIADSGVNEPEAEGAGVDEPGNDLAESRVPDGDIAEEADEPMSPEEEAWVQARTELLELADLLIGAVTARVNDDPVMALGRLEMAMAKMPQAHRNARAVLTGTTAAPARTARTAAGGNAPGAGGTVRPGALRDRVLAHLTEHPGKDFTPYEIGRVLDASSGAVANALDRLVGLGQAELTCERPRRFKLGADSALGN